MSSPISWASSRFPPSPATIITVQMKETGALGPAVCPALPLVGACPLSSHSLLPKSQQGGYAAVTHLQVGN